MGSVISERLQNIRHWMDQRHLDAFIVPTNDPHNSEYVAGHWETRKWITGFTGSAGTAVITMEKAGLWTDSRYFLQAAEQLKGSGIDLFKDRLPETPSIGQWLSEELGSRPRVGIDGWVDTGAFDADLLEFTHSSPIYTEDPFEEIWTGRPPLPDAAVVVHELVFAGEPYKNKKERLLDFLEKRYPDCGGILLSALDDIAWMLNLRGNDVHCNPVFVSYFYLDIYGGGMLYIPDGKLTPEAQAELSKEGIETRPYMQVESDMKALDVRVLVDASLNSCLKKAVGKMTVVSPGPVSMMKSVKNGTELEGFHRCMERDGVAMVKFLRWIKPAVRKGGETELSIDRKLYGFRAEQKYFKGISFDTIAGYAHHAAIVHYEADEKTDIPLKAQGMLLLDSGGQYLDGTTDLTRTVILGPVSEEEKKDYTLVLKGMLHLQNVSFPEGTSGGWLDIMARQFMWKAGINYLHGTGHGVGSYLCVHEGPHQIRINYLTPLRPGMLLTDEPGIYKAGRHGVRIENTLLIVPDQKTEFGAFYRFEPLTLCPIDKEGIVMEMMTDEEIGWLDNYHKEVYRRLAPLLDEEHRQWLEEATSPLKV